MPQAGESATAADFRVRPAANFLWAANAATPADYFERGFALLTDAGRRATERWGDLFEGVAELRLVHDLASPPPAAILALAEKAGIKLAPFGSGLAERSAICDLAIVSDDEDEVFPYDLPWLVLVADQPGLSMLSIFAGTTGPFGRETEARTRVAASVDTIAETLFAPTGGPRGRARLDDYLKEETGARPLRFEYDFLLRLMGDRAVAGPEEVEPWRQARELAGEASGAALDVLRREYERADGLATAYGQRWRSTFAARSFLLFALNLSSGVAGALFPAYTVYTVIFQVAVTAFTYGDQYAAKHGKWRTKWLDYRRLAEATRVARYCLIAGVPSPSASRSGWVDGRLARVARAASPPLWLGEDRAKAYLDYLKNIEIDGQVRYHLGAHRRLRALDVRLGRAATAMLVGAAILGAISALANFLHYSPFSLPLMGAVGLIVSAGPGLHASLTNLRNQLDVARQAERSEGRAASLRELSNAISAAAPNASLARAAAAKAAQIMHEDVMTWDRVMEIL